MRRGTLHAATYFLLAASVCSCCSHRREEARSEERSMRRVERLERLDSLLRVTVVEADSPEITIEWLDTPRRRVTAHARRVTARAAETNTVKLRTGRLDSVHAGAQIRSKEQTRPTAAGRLCLWLAGALCAGVIVLSYAKIRSRR